MSAKITIKTNKETEEYFVVLEEKDNEISFKDNRSNIIKINLSLKTLKKIDKDYDLFFDFLNNSFILNIGGKEMVTKISKSSFKIGDNYLKISYTLNETEVVFLLERL